MSQDDDIAALKREVAALKSALPTARDDRAEREWLAQVHRLREERMDRASPPMSREELAAMEAACPKDAIADIVAHRVVPERSAAGASGEITLGSPNPGLSRGSGWVNATPLGPPPGQEAIRRTADAMAPHGPLHGKQAKEEPTKE
jgi:hypothetical protein